MIVLNCEQLLSQDETFSNGYSARCHLILVPKKN